MTTLGSLSIHDLRCGSTTTKSDALEFSKPAGLDFLLTEPTDTEHHSQKCLQGVAGEMFLPALAETIGLVLSNHVVAHRHL